MRTMLSIMVLMLIPLGVDGYSRNPNMEIVGSYFPGWLLSLIAGVLLTFAAHALLRRKGLSRAAGHPAIIYPSLVLLFTCLLWLCFFA